MANNKLYKSFKNTFLLITALILVITFLGLDLDRNKNKYDKLDRKFHDSVNKGYKLIYNKKRFIKIDASKPITQINDEIINYVNSFL